MKGGGAATVLIKPLRSRPMTTHINRKTGGEDIFGAAALWMLSWVLLLSERVDDGDLQRACK